MEFQRARSDEQREARRAAILETAAAMLEEMPVDDVTLNELSRRVGLAKSNVLRYFESREAVLLELLDVFFGAWLAELEVQLAAGVHVDADMEERARQFAGVLSRSIAEQVVLCDLFAAQGGVLEHNVSTDVVRRYKRSSLERLTTMSALVGRVLPELGEGAQHFCFMTLVSAGALSTYVPPPPALLAAYAEEPELAVLNLDLTDAVHRFVLAELLGALPRV